MRMLRLGSKLEARRGRGAASVGEALSEKVIIVLQP